MFSCEFSPLIRQVFKDFADKTSSWVDRIPFVLLFGISTSIDLFEEKLSQSTLKKLRGKRFDLAQIEIDTLFKAAITSTHTKTVLLGSGFSRVILQRQRDHTQSSNDFIRTLKVISMRNTCPSSSLTFTVCIHVLLLQ